MTEPNSRLELKEWCLRDLGYPVIDINVADQQLEDKIDLAIQYFNEWHYEGVEKLLMKHQLTSSTLKFAAPLPANAYREGELVVGSVSGAKSYVAKINSDNMSMDVWQTVGIFVPSESIVSQTSSNSLVSTADAFTLGDLDNKFISIPNHVMSVTKIFPVNATLTANYLFDPMYYTMFDAVFGFGGLDLISYEILKERLNQINQMFVGEKPIRFNRKTEKLYIDFDWIRAVRPGTYIMIECYRILNPNDYSTLWNDYFLKQYTSALFKIQWGHNLSKFAGIQLPGGVTLDGPRILEEGKTEKAELEDQMKNGRWSAPLGFEMG